MDEFEYYSDEYANHGEDLSYLGQYYGYKGTYYKGIEKLDSAEYYYRILLSRSHNIDNLSMASMGLLSLYQKLGYSDSIAKYAALYCQTNDSANLAHSSEEVVRTQALYNYQEHERIAVLKDKEALYYRRIVISLIIAVLLSTYSIYIYIKRQKLRTRKELMKANSAYNSLLSQYNQAKSDLDLTQEGLDEYQKEKEAEIQKLKMGLALYHENPSQLDAWDMEQAMLHSPIVKKLHELASQVKPPSQIQWHDFRQFAEEYLPDFFNKVNDKEKRLTYQEVLICLLVRLHFIPTELAALLGVSKQRITNLRGHINYVLFNERSSKTLNDNILAL